MVYIGTWYISHRVARAKVCCTKVTVEVFVSNAERIRDQLCRTGCWWQHSGQVSAAAGHSPADTAAATPAPALVSCRQADQGAGWSWSVELMARWIQNTISTIYILHHRVAGICVSHSASISAVAGPVPVLAWSWSQP